MDSSETDKFFAGKGIVLMEKGRRGGLTYLCDKPEEFGVVTELKVVSGRIVAKTESGVEMIVPSKSVESSSKDS